MVSRDRTASRTCTAFKQTHVQTLVDLWLKQDLSPGTIKNRMSCLRWWADRGTHLHLKASWAKGGRELTGWPSPHAGGPSKGKLSEAQRQRDQQARLTISK